MPSVPYSCDHDAVDVKRRLCAQARTQRPESNSLGRRQRGRISPPDSATALRTVFSSTSNRSATSLNVNPSAYRTTARRRSLSLSPGVLSDAPARRANDGTVPRCTPYLLAITRTGGWLRSVSGRSACVGPLFTKSPVREKNRRLHCLVDPFASHLQSSRFPDRRGTVCVSESAGTVETEMKKT